MKKQNAFTLIELLAVIVILAIIAVIATPLTINVINSSKEKSFINSVYGLIDGVRLLSAEQVFDNGSNEVVVNFTDGAADNTNFKVSGDMPDYGTIRVNSEGKVQLKVWNEDLGKCAEKMATESEVYFTTTQKEECILEIKTFTEVMEKEIETGQVMKDTTADQNLRYVGKDPKNYIWFNKDSKGNSEKWRIIGVFHDEKKGDQIKIIRNDYLVLNNSKSMQWDSNNKNNWSTASLNTLWNDMDDETSYIRTIQKNDPTSFGYIDLNHVWNIGAYDSTFSTIGTRNAFYLAERSDVPAGAEGSETTWTGAIGLIYPSDYGYASSGSIEMCDGKEMYNWGTEDYKKECAENSWLYTSDAAYQWTMTPRSDGSGYAFGVSNNQGRINSYSVGNDSAVWPVLYIKFGTKIVGGKGTTDEPYELGI